MRQPVNMVAIERDTVVSLAAAAYAKSGRNPAGTVMTLVATAAAVARSYVNPAPGATREEANAEISTMVNALFRELISSDEPIAQLAVNPDGSTIVGEGALFEAIMRNRT